MKKITKKQISQIRQGYHYVLMDCLDFLLDTYQEDKWDLGYESCLSDTSLRSERLAEYIVKQAEKKGKIGKDANGETTVYFNDSSDLAKVIETYFTKHLKQK